MVAHHSPHVYEAQFRRPLRAACTIWSAVRERGSGELLGLIGDPVGERFMDVLNGEGNNAGAFVAMQLRDPAR